MTHNIIKTENYLLVINDSEIKEGDLLWSFSNEKIVVARKVTDLYIHSKKIIAHLPINNSFTLKGVDLLPNIEEDDVEKLAEKEFPNLYQPMKGLDTTLLLREGFQSGYNRSKEKYKWTEEDLMKVIELTRSLYLEDSLKANMLKIDKLEKIQKEIIQSLSQPKMPVGFECEIEWYNPKTNQSADSLPEITGLNDNDGCYMKPKTITNPQGQTVWLGKYIY